MTSLRPWPKGALVAETVRKQQFTHRDFIAHHVLSPLAWLLCVAFFIVWHGNASLGLGWGGWVCIPREFELLPGNLHMVNWKFRHLGVSHLLLGISSVNLGLTTLRSYNQPSTDLFQPLSWIHLNPSPTERACNPWKVLVTWLACWRCHNILFNYY